MLPAEETPDLTSEALTKARFGGSPQTYLRTVEAPTGNERFGEAPLTAESCMESILH
jgi:hypothetical protein